MATKTDVLFNLDRMPRLKRVAVNVSGAGNNTLVAAVTGKKIRVYQVLLIAAGAVTATFESGAGGTDISGPMALAANTGFSSGWAPIGHFETAEGELLNLSLGGAVQVGGWLTYAEI